MKRQSLQNLDENMKIELICLYKKSHPYEDVYLNSVTFKKAFKWVQTPEIMKMVKNTLNFQK
jgi:hypothetical protein